MTFDEIFSAALKQSAIDLNCLPEDLVSGENRVVISQTNPMARKYLTLPFACNLVSYGGNIVASVSPQFHSAASAYISRFSSWSCFETPNLHVLSQAVEPLGHRICFMAEYFLPVPEKLLTAECPFKTKLLTQKDFPPLYTPEWSNALCAKRPQLDEFGIGAFDGERLVGLAACSADCDSMRQIGIDVLPEYRRMGIASALTGRLAAEILARGKVPFYCAAWSNIRSVRNALKSGFVPAWVEMTVKEKAFADELMG